MESVNWSYYDKFGGIISKYMPRQGEGKTLASQIVTAVNKLVYKWYNDGDVFDNTYEMEGWVNDLSSYANWLYTYVPVTQNILAGITACYSNEDYENLLKDLADITLDEKMLEWANESKAISSIYGDNFDGPFHFNDRWGDDEEDNEIGWEEDDDDDYRGEEED